MTIPLIIIAGPTAVGKSELALQLALKLDGEIVSADSMQVYKYLNIGTAKPSSQEQRKVQHHLIDLVEPDQKFSVADYQTWFERVVAEIADRGKLPIMVGGTGLYIRACLRGFYFGPGGPNPQFRQDLKAWAAAQGGEALHQRLVAVDPQAAARISPQDQRRVIRALEVLKFTGSRFSEQAPAKPSQQYRPLYLFLDRPRSELYQRIESRVDRMIAAGWVAEVAGLIDRGYPVDLPSMQGLGYRQICAYLQQQMTLPEAIAAIKQQTRNYAKRQLTWFRKEPIDRWFTITGATLKYWEEILGYLEGRLKQHVE